MYDGLDVDLMMVSMRRVSLRIDQAEAYDVSSSPFYALCIPAAIMEINAGFCFRSPSSLEDLKQRRALCSLCFTTVVSVTVHYWIIYLCKSARECPLLHLSDEIR